MSELNIRPNDDLRPITSDQVAAIENWLDLMARYPTDWKDQMLDVWAGNIRLWGPNRKKFDSGFFWLVPALTTEEERTAYLARRRLGL